MWVWCTRVRATRRQWIAFVVAVVALAGLAAFSVVRFRATTAITHFLTSPGERRMAEISRRLADSELTRTMVLAVSAPQLDVALAASAELADALRDHPEVAWLRDRVEQGTEEAVYGLYFPRRFMFVSDRPDEELDALLSDDGLRERAVELKRQLGLPTAPLIKKLAPDDPWLLFPERARQLELAQMGRLELVDGRFVSRDRSHAIVFLATRHSPFDSAHQAPLERALVEAWDGIAARHGGRPVLERSSIHRFALQSEQAIRADITRISIASTVAIVALFVVVYRSLRLMLLAFIPLLAGVIVATAVGLLAFGELHGLTLAFGASMIGVCIDYPVHYFTHHALEPDPSGPHGSLRRVWPGLLIGALTTVAGFAGMAWTSFPAIREIGLFGSVGIAAALLATRVLLPPLLPLRPRDVPLRRRLAGGLDRIVTAMGARRRALVVLPALAVLVCAVGLPRLSWIDDAAALNRLQPEMLEEDRRVRDLVARVDTGRFIIALGATEEEALARNDAVFARLEDAAARGVTAFSSLHGLLWSAELQRRNLERLRATPGLVERTLDALEREGFRRELFAGLHDALRETPEPLRYDDLLDSPLAPVVRPFRVTLGDEVALLSFVRDVTDPAALSAALAGLEGVHDWDQRAFMERAYAHYRGRILDLLLWGLVAVGAVLLVRYRDVRTTLAAFVPALLAAACSLAAFGLVGVEVHVLHVVGLLMVLSIGVDYGVFLAETAAERAALRATVLSLVIACLSTVFAFGLLALSTNPALRAVGLTTGIGVFLSLVLAPTTLVLLRAGGRE